MDLYRLSFYVPGDGLEGVKTALFAVGAGHIGNYDQCCWQTRGQGQFRPLPGSEAVIGELGQLTQLEEWKVEMVCEGKNLKRILAALKAAHPYEEVAYDVLQMVDVDVL